MPKQDHVTAWQRHERAVADLCRMLRKMGLVEHRGLPLDLPPFSYAKAARRSIIPQARIVPRDLVARLDGGIFSLKVYFTDGVAHSNLFRSLAYVVLNDPDEGYLQVVMGGRDLPIPWLKHIQGPLDAASPSGIHGVGAFLDVVQAATAANPDKLHSTSKVMNHD